MSPIYFLASLAFFSTVFDAFNISQCTPNHLETTFFPIKPNALDVYRGNYFLPILKGEVLRKRKKYHSKKDGH
jgi:hypothetical protein